MAQWDEHESMGEGAPGGNGRAPGAMTTGMSQEQIQEAIENAREQIDHYVEAAADFVRQRPVVTLAGAVALGYLIGKLASRK